jgi:hypothetical protein
VQKEADQLEDDLVSIAADAIYKCVERCIDSDVTHEDYPDIGEHDWNRVRDTAIAMAHESLDLQEVYGAAYKRLAERADNGTTTP